MAKKRYSAEQIIQLLREVEIHTSEGKTISQASRQIGVTEQTADLMWKLVLEHPPWPPQNFQDFSNLLQIIGRQIGFVFKNHGAL